VDVLSCANARADGTAKDDGRLGAKYVHSGQAFIGVAPASVMTEDGLEMRLQEDLPD
jgi:hypothetical protein